MFAIVSHNNKQYKFETDKVYEIDLTANDGKKIVFSEVLMISDDKKTSVGNPNIKDATVEAEVIEDTKGDKVEVFKFHAKKHYKRCNGHRQNYTKVKITSINA